VWKGRGVLLSWFWTGKNKAHHTVDIQSNGNGYRSIAIGRINIQRNRERERERERGRRRRIHRGLSGTDTEGKVHPAKPISATASLSAKKVILYTEGENLRERERERSQILLFGEIFLSLQGKSHGLWYIGLCGMNLSDCKTPYFFVTKFSLFVG
jgi:hypothetical protein